MSSQWDHVLNGGVLDDFMPEIDRDRERGQAQLARLNAIPLSDRAARQAMAAELFAAFPPSCVLFSPFTCEFGRNIRFGEHSFVNVNVTMVDLGEIHIGSHVMIAPNVQIYTATHSLDYLSRREWLTTAEKVVIGDDCWIGGGAIILPGVSIGPRSVIGAGAVVTRDIPADSLAVGNPARVIRRLNQQGNR
ncbi:MULTISPECIES: sugar O-acetyltransferase [unclassified Paludibacterium]|uniref:sugar O-acetyltransferase n=1 Tax=unclassified Paludibacterium TaxID=2618429 RepID=UPI001C053273|nr:sugar O-acetyltransferase [Paludibacterium sp. B53371]BEV71673.1 sugar O-acetyltransferase [Paludibacterium sp. THUN1379]